jgi:chitin disaccharide deacetylase
MMPVKGLQPFWNGVDRDSKGSKFKGRMSKLLIINADDLGLSREVNSGILLGLEHGFASDTSLLAKALYADEAVKGLKALNVRHVGIHINLDEMFGWRPGGIELKTRPVLSSMLNDKKFLQDCTHEAKDQIETFLSFGLIPTHLDTHHHVHGYFPIFQMLVELLLEYGIPAMRFSRYGYRLPTRKDIPYDDESYAHMRDMLKRKGIVYCSNFLEGAMRVDDVNPGITELVAHPSLGGDPWRSQELKVLQLKAKADSLWQRDIKSVSFRDLLQGEGA